MFISMCVCGLLVRCSGTNRGWSHGRVYIITCYVGDVRECDKTSHVPISIKVGWCSKKSNKDGLLRWQAVGQSLQALADREALTCTVCIQQ